MQSLQQSSLHLFKKSLSCSVERQSIHCSDNLGPFFQVQDSLLLYAYLQWTTVTFCFPYIICCQVWSELSSWFWLPFLVNCQIFLAKPYSFFNILNLGDTGMTSRITVYLSYYYIKHANHVCICIYSLFVPFSSDWYFSLLARFIPFNLINIVSIYFKAIAVLFFLVVIY